MPSFRRILFVTKGEDAASTRYRALMYFPLLREAGWEPSHTPSPRRLGGWLSLLKQARNADVVVLLRRMPRPPLSWLLRRAAKRLVFDMDDAVFMNNQGGVAPSRLKRFQHIVKLCDEVWAGNDYLAEHARRICPTVTVLPTSVPIDKYGLAAPKPSATMDLVWIGSSSTRPYLEQVMPVLAEARRRVPNLRLKIIADFDLPDQDIPTEAVQWTEAGEAEALATSHIGIAPMPNDPWTQGKCGCKVVQYMASRLPVVASRVPIHAALMRDQETGLLAGGTREWIDAIERLAADAALRQQYGDAGFHRAHEHLTLKVTFEKMRGRLEAMTPEGQGA